MTSHSTRIILAAVFISAFTISVAAWADPPGRVGRLNYISGSVSQHADDAAEWAPATVNYPLTIGDHLRTDAGGQAEVHVGSTAFRLASDTEISFLNLDDQAIQVRLFTGSLNVRLRHLGADEEIELDTPNASLSILRAGTYRVDVRQGGDTSVTTRTGEIEVTAGGSVFPVRLRQTAIITGADSPTYEVSAAAAPDNWDAWCLARDSREDQVASATYVPRNTVAGVEDLDDYGTWSQDTDLGPIWVPRVTVVGWAPYRFGHWAWVAPWGWTWIDDAPWGFAPFHYGRWAFRFNRWAWVPGPAIFHPVYSPAMVVFVGGGDWLSGRAPGGSVGWFPLGPHEPYVPPYNHTRLHNVDVEHFNYVNRTVPGAVTVVAGNDFIRGHAVGAAAFALRQDEVLKAPVMGARPPVAPRKAQPLARAGTRAVVPRPAPPPVPAPVLRPQVLRPQVLRPQGLGPQVLQARPGMVVPAPSPSPRYIAPRLRRPPAAPGGGSRYPDRRYDDPLLYLDGR